MHENREASGIPPTETSRRTAGEGLAATRPAFIGMTKSLKGKKKSPDSISRIWGQGLNSPPPKSAQKEATIALAERKWPEGAISENPLYLPSFVGESRNLPISWEP